MIRLCESNSARPALRNGSGGSRLKHYDGTRRWLPSVKSAVACPAMGVEPVAEGHHGSEARGDERWSS
jgi:hypothetical protein